ncbi:hypothetical protein Pcinc_010660 [Petrolisthes cinctipes]|uniref:Retinol dehydrogenase 11 n=1 Tax=Petrolisthes cinctipes TaxID=88211 RepID=A0AAE1G4G9_PETCI|nr:hypothetical protein Pcinc_010660 [Petrolisthes cinctipes]
MLYVTGYLPYRHDLQLSASSHLASPLLSVGYDTVSIGKTTTLPTANHKWLTHTYKEDDFKISAYTTHERGARSLSLLAAASYTSVTCYLPAGVRMLFEVLVTVVVLVVSVRVWYLTTSGRCHSTRSMKGKTVIVTGGSAGIGLHTAEDLVRRGARVILACRNLEKAYKVAAQLKAEASQGGEVAVRLLDTSDLNSVRTFAKEILDTEKHIHVLINNAGISEPPEKVITNEGLELTMATNHFGHFLLTNLLLERLKQSAPSRIVNVSSLFHTFVSSLDLNSLNFEKEVYRRYVPYNRSKLCNVLFSLELARRLEGSGVTANSLHPGVVKTDILVAYHTIRGMIMKLVFMLWAKDSELGAQTNIYLAVSEEVEGVSGRYFTDCKQVKPSKLARDKDLAKRLWEVSEKAVKLRPEEKFC